MSSFASKVLSEILAYYQHKLDNDLCTMEEIDNAIKVLEDNMVVYGSISDFAEFYGKPKSNVRVEISRKLFAKPKRVLLYPFHAFRKIVPESWRKK